MKKLIMALALLSSSASFAGDLVTYSCKTQKGTSVQVVFDNWPPRLLSLSIDGKSLMSQTIGFGTSAGAPFFTVVDFPQHGQKTAFDLNSRSYSVDYSKYPISCTFDDGRKTQDGF